MSLQNNPLLMQLKQKLEAQNPKPADNKTGSNKFKQSTAGTSSQRSTTNQSNAHSSAPARSFSPEVVYNPSVSLNEFYRQVLEANNLPTQSPEILEGNWPLLDPAHLEREDLTQLNFFTIDSSSSQDLDDAICIETTADGWLLHLAFADPAAYLAQGSVLDIEAKLRGSSFYLPNQVINLLPSELSNNLASLLANQRRPALVIRVVINQQGGVEGEVEFKLAWVASQAKLDYRSVAQWLEDASCDTANQELLPSLQALAAFAQARHSWRKKHQLVSPNQPDFRFIVNETTQQVDLKVEEKNLAHTLIEESMLLANQLGAEFLANTVKAGIFTSYPGIKADKINQVEDLLLQADIKGFSLPELTSLEGYLDLQAKLEEINNPWLSIKLKRLNENLNLTLNPELHLGLGVKYYASITAPLRRYQDLINLRLIKAHLIGEQLHLPSSLEVEHLNTLRYKQRRAENLIKNQLYALYLTDKIGKQFTGTIFNINKGGVRVNFKENGASAFIPLSLLLPKHQHKTPNIEAGWVEANNKPLYRLGDEMKVSLAEVKTHQTSLIAKQISE